MNKAVETVLVQSNFDPFQHKLSVLWVYSRRWSLHVNRRCLMFPYSTYGQA